jgi:two-component system phosphate regulon sensor histidine kinase PhoR
MVIIRCFLISVSAVILSGLISAITVGNIREKELTRNMKSMINVILVEYNLTTSPNQTAEKLDELIGNNRVTIISQDGTVIGDSRADITKMENHIDREEIKNASSDKFSIVKRFSTTLNSSMLYVAKATEEGTVIRLAVPIDFVKHSMVSLIPAIIIGCFAAILFSQGVARKTANDIIKPLKSVELAIKNVGTVEQIIKIEPTKYEEINPIIYRLNSMSENLTSSLNMLEDEKNKYSFILENVNEGLVLIGMDLKILHINRAAKQYFNVGGNSIGQDLSYLSRDEKITSAIISSKEKLQSVLFDSEETQEGAVISVKIIPAYFKEDGKRDTKGILMVLSDVTHVRKTEQIRSEFVANASHELKTPLTSVKGFTEILASGMITDSEVMNDYLKRIQNETDRMITLINDILNIYQLEEGDASSEIVRLNLRTVVDEVVNGLLPQVKAKSIKLEITERDIYYNIAREDIKHIIQNLIDNAIKYNVENGYVKIDISENNQSVKLIVTDSGIGIPRAFQTRVFERFFRIDKGRSRKVGGTGLGLSIVKHTVAKYKGEITLYSREGKGCKIEIILPKIL